jgi:cyclophilin family peptidyl-prolyl cis-trans isomerase
LDDSVSHVRLAAIDALAGPCPAKDEVAAVLKQIVAGSPRGNVFRDRLTWHGKAHALAALARVDSVSAPELLRRESRNPVWQVRMYAARGAAVVKDSALLTSLAFDSVGNVREAAIQGLSTMVGHVADLVYVRALTSRDYHVVLAAARALKGAPVRDSVLPGVLLALERISREQRQTSRDPRMELLARVRDFGDRETAPRLQDLLSDVDEEVAAEAAGVMNQLTGSSQYVKGTRRQVSVAMPASGTVRVQVTMSPASGGGSFDVEFDGNRAPWSTARVVALIRSKYFDGLTFHRVVPNFVLQGGSPAMNEYVGDGPFMRDELSLAHHNRYTLGISTRGRDTGDAQWFINLVDNYRLDHDYTVIGRISRGFNVVDRILEGDTMQTVRILPPARSTGDRTSR